MAGSSIRGRMALYLEYKGVSDYRFEKDLGLSKGYWNKAKNPTSEILEKFVGLYSDISSEWLLTGSGDMLKQVMAQDASTPSSGIGAERSFLEKEAFYLRLIRDKNADLIKAMETIERKDQEILKLELEIDAMKKKLESKRVG